MLNWIIDFSLRHRFAEAQNLLVQSLEENAAGLSAQTVPEPAPAAPEAQA